jgi:dTMP kinase
MKTPFIVFEGADGAGTTTQAKALVERLRGMGIPVQLTAEPTYGPVGAMIRANLRANVDDLSWRVMTHLFAADRCWHIENEIRPLLEQGTVVVCDRFYHSTVVYQGLAEGGGRERMRALACEVRAGVASRFHTLGVSWWIEPTMTFVLNGPVDVLWDRVISRGGRPDQYEKPEFHKQVVEAYQSFGWDSVLECGTLRMIDGTQALNEVANACWKYIQWNFTPEARDEWKLERNERHTEQWRAVP